MATKKKSRRQGVTPLGEGRYEITGTWNHPKTGRRKTLRKRIEAANVGEAVRIREAMLAEAKQGRARVKRARVRLREFAASFVSSGITSGRLKRSTSETYAWHLDARILPALGDYYLDAIEPLDVRQWFNGLSASPHVANGALRVLRTLLRAAEAEEYIDRDPSRRVQSRRLPRRETNTKVLAAHELRALLEAARRAAPRWYAMILLLAETGARWGEASALKWSDIDTAGRSIRIERAQWHGHLGETKTGVVRTVPISEELAQVLREHRQRLVREQAPGIDAGWVFPSRTGGLSQPSACYAAIDAAAEAAGLSRKVRPHCFRHTLNNLVRQAAGGQVARAITGHVTEEMTEHYSEVSLDERRAAHEKALIAIRRPLDVDTNVDTPTPRSRNGRSRSPRNRP